MTHVPLHWPPDRPEFGTPVIEKRSDIEKPIGFRVDNQKTGSNAGLEDLISLAIALNYFGRAEGDANDQAPITRLRKPSSVEHGSTHPWRTAVDCAVAERRRDGDSSTLSH